jgi:hypothetical protein
MAIPADSTLQSYSFGLKQSYIDSGEIKNVMIESGPILAELLERADTSRGGANIPIPIILGSGGGTGSNFSAASGGASPAFGLAFQLTRGYTYGVGLVSGETLVASEKESDAFIANMKLEMDTKKRRVSQNLAAYLYGDGTGVMAQISSSQTVSSTTLTLADPSTAVRFQKGDWVQIAGTVGGSVRTAGTNTTLGNFGYASSVAGCAQVINVTYTGANAGTMTLSGTGGSTAIALNTIWSAVAQGDFIYLAGDNANNSQGSSNIPWTTANSAIPSGFLAWIPPGGPASNDSFYGQNRYNYSLSYGQVVDATAAGLNLGSIREALTLTVSEIHQISGYPTDIACNPVAFYNLSLSLQSQGMYPGGSGQGPSGEGSFGFAKLKLPTPHGVLDVVSDPQCAPFLNPATYSPANGYSGAMTAFVLEMDSWGMFSAGEIPHLEEKDGLLFLRAQTADMYQYQFKSYWNAASRAPAHSAATLLPNG